MNKTPQPCIVRGLIEPEQAQQLKEFLQFAYMMAEESSKQEVQQALKWGGLALQSLRPQIDHLVEPIERGVRLRWPKARLVDEVSAFRRVERSDGGRDTYIYWHMDADGTGSHTYDPLFNCWLPLEEVEGYAFILGNNTGYPSLEVIVNSEKLMRKVGPNSGPLEANRAHRPQEWVEEHLPQREMLCPHLRPGDALIFSHYLLHRTQPLSHLRGPRIGCEMRFTLQRPEGRVLSRMRQLYLKVRRRG